MPSNPFEKTEVDPSFSKEERLLNDALAAAVGMEALPQQERVLFPPRWGYERKEPGIVEVLHTNRVSPDQRFDYSGVQTRYSSTTRPSIGQV